MPRQRNLRRFPSYRNLQVYHEVAYERRSQAVVGKMFAISQERVSRISRQVRDWVDATVPPRAFIGQAGLRLHLAVARERVRLHDAHDPLLELILGEDEQPRFIRRRVTVVGGEALQTVEISELPNYRLWRQAGEVQARLAELEAVANRGPLADAPDRVLQTTIHRSNGRKLAVFNGAEDESNRLKNDGGGVLSAYPTAPEPSPQPEELPAFAPIVRGLLPSENSGTERA
jgi:hypothetical protein